MTLNVVAMGALSVHLQYEDECDVDTRGLVVWIDDRERWERGSHCPKRRLTCLHVGQGWGPTSSCCRTRQSQPGAANARSCRSAHGHADVRAVTRVAPGLLFDRDRSAHGCLIYVRADPIVPGLGVIRDDQQDPGPGPVIPIAPTGCVSSSSTSHQIGSCEPAPERIANSGTQPSSVPSSRT